MARKRGARKRQRMGRVQLSPGTARWMMGDRYGDLMAVSKDGETYTVKLDKSGKTLKFKRRDIGEVF